MSLFTPINQKRLTNVSIIRLKKNGNRYEIACYPNKVKAWREGIEKRIDEVLQTREIFFNVSKGQFATKADIMRDFNNDDDDAVINQILNDGEIQFTEKERNLEMQNLFRDVAKIVSEKCVNPETNRAYTVTMTEKMMRDCHVNLQCKKSAKQQALGVIRQLKAVEGFKIAPAMLDILISLDPKLVETLSPQILKLVHQISRQGRNSDGIFEFRAIIEPDNYHELSRKLDDLAKNRFCLEVIGSAQRNSEVSGNRGKQSNSKNKNMKNKTVDSIPESVPEGASSLERSSADCSAEHEVVATSVVMTEPSAISSEPPAQSQKTGALGDSDSDDYYSMAGRKAAREKKKRNKRKAAAATLARAN